MDNNKKELQIKVSEEVFKGAYANNVMISHTNSEFLLDFISIFSPQGQAQGILNSRVILTPEHAKRLVKVLEDNIEMYEESFGEIKEAKVPVTPVAPEGAAH